MSISGFDSLEPASVYQFEVEIFAGEAVPLSTLGFVTLESPT